jgi:hypothetical protein
VSTVSTNCGGPHPGWESRARLGSASIPRGRSWSPTPAVNFPPQSANASTPHSGGAATDRRVLDALDPTGVRLAEIDPPIRNRSLPPALLSASLVDLRLSTFDVELLTGRLARSVRSVRYSCSNGGAVDDRHTLGERFGRVGPVGLGHRPEDDSLATSLTRGHSGHSRPVGLETRVSAVLLAQRGQVLPVVASRVRQFLHR